MTDDSVCFLLSTRARLQLPTQGGQRPSKSQKWACGCFLFLLAETFKLRDPIGSLKDMNHRETLTRQAMNRLTWPATNWHTCGSTLRDVASFTLLICTAIFHWTNSPIYANSYFVSRELIRSRCVSTCVIVPVRSVKQAATQIESQPSISAILGINHFDQEVRWS